MSQFFGQQTLAAQYFRPNYLHGAGGTPPTQDGKSGYWRLFYYQLQEAELEKEKLKRAQEQEKETAEGKSEATSKAATVVQNTKPVKLIPLEVYEKLEFKRKAIYTQPTKIQAKLPAAVKVVDSELGRMYKEFAPRILAWQIQEQQKVEAANDADNRIRLLLLLAA